MAWEAIALPLGNTRERVADYSQPINRCQVEEDQSVIILYLCQTLNPMS